MRLHCHELRGFDWRSGFFARIGIVAWGRGAAATRRRGAASPTPTGCASRRAPLGPFAFDFPFGPRHSGRSNPGGPRAGPGRPRWRLGTKGRGHSSGPAPHPSPPRPLGDGSDTGDYKSEAPPPGWPRLSAATPSLLPATAWHVLSPVCMAACSPSSPRHPAWTGLVPLSPRGPAEADGLQPLKHDMVPSAQAWAT